MTGRAPTVRMRVTRLALVGLFALASHALLPYLHVLASDCGSNASSCSTEGQASHSADCPVCSALAHAGARAASTPSAPMISAAPAGPATALCLTVAQPPSIALAGAPARAPPASLPIA
jgi:hypothetical protein